MKNNQDAYYILYSHAFEFTNKLLQCSEAKRLNNIGQLFWITYFPRTINNIVSLEINLHYQLKNTLTCEGIQGINGVYIKTLPISMATESKKGFTFSLVTVPLS